MPNKKISSKIAPYALIALVLAFAFIKFTNFKLGNNTEQNNTDLTDIETYVQINGLPATKQIEINGQAFKLAVADDADKRAKGLSGVTHLEDGYGMLFSYDQPATPSFWMNEMLIDIDLVWVENGVVVGVIEYLSSSPELQQILYPAPQPITSAIELSAGSVAKYNIKKGDLLIYQP